MTIRPVGRFADYFTFLMLNDLVTRCTHLGLCTADPEAVNDPLTVELAGSGYSRAAVSLVRSSRTLRNSLSLTWQGIVGGTVVTHIAGWDAAFNGNLLLAFPISGVAYSQSLITGGLYIAPNDLWISL